MRVRPAAKAAADAVAFKVARIAAQIGARELTERLRVPDGNSVYEVAACYEVESKAGRITFSVDAEHDVTGVYMRFMGERDKVNQLVRFPELNRCSGKCNAYVEGPDHAARGLRLLEERLAAFGLPCMSDAPQQDVAMDAAHA